MKNIIINKFSGENIVLSGVGEGGEVITLTDILEDSDVYQTVKDAVPIQYKVLRGYPFITLTEEPTELESSMGKVSLQLQKVDENSRNKVLATIESKFPEYVQPLVASLTSLKSYMTRVKNKDIYIDIEALTDLSPTTRSNIIAFNRQLGAEPKDKFNAGRTLVLTEPSSKLFYELVPFRTIDRFAKNQFSELADMYDITYPNVGLAHQNNPATFFGMDLVSWEKNMKIIGYSFPKEYISGHKGIEEEPIYENEKEFYESCVALMNEGIMEQFKDTGKSLEELVGEGVYSKDVASYFKNIAALVLENLWGHLGRNTFPLTVDVEDDDGETEEEYVMEVPGYGEVLIPGPGVKANATGPNNKRYHVRQIAGAGEKTSFALMDPAIRVLERYVETRQNSYAWIEAIIKLSRWGDRRPASLYITSLTDSEEDKLYLDMEKLSITKFAGDWGALEIEQVDGYNSYIEAIITGKFITQDQGYKVSKGYDDIPTQFEFPVGLAVVTNFKSGEVRKRSIIDFITLTDMLLAGEGNVSIRGVSLTDDNKLSIDPNEYSLVDIVSLPEYNAIWGEPATNDNGVDSYLSIVPNVDIIETVMALDSTMDDKSYNFYNAWVVFTSLPNIMQGVVPGMFTTQEELAENIASGAVTDVKSAFLLKFAYEYGKVLYDTVLKTLTDKTLTDQIDLNTGDFSLLDLEVVGNYMYESYRDRGKASSQETLTEQQPKIDLFHNVEKAKHVLPGGHPMRTKDGRVIGFVELSNNNRKFDIAHVSEVDNSHDGPGFSADQVVGMIYQVYQSQREVFNRQVEAGNWKFVSEDTWDLIVEDYNK